MVARAFHSFVASIFPCLMKQTTSTGKLLLEILWCYRWRPGMTLLNDRKLFPRRPSQTRCGATPGANCSALNTARSVGEHSGSPDGQPGSGISAHDRRRYHRPSRPVPGGCFDELPGLSARPYFMMMLPELPPIFVAALPARHRHLFRTPHP